MTVDSAMALHPSVRWVFAAYHLSGCTNCSSSSAETLAEVATGYGLPLDRLLADLNALLV
jgi:hybrid cluster-associated redox disulfide protein